MQDLRVIGVESGALLVASDAGDRFRLPIDDVLKSKLRQAQPAAGESRKLSPKEIQAHIRSGMSADDVAAITGASLEYIERFEGPVLAEREYVVESALAVPVHTAADTDPLSDAQTFGSVIMSRLHELGASDERWASWKEAAGGWVIKLSFTADQIDHDARWSFDPRKSALAPLNNEAITLSQQGRLTGSLIPRLRAVDVQERVPDATRFDSGAFDDSDLFHADTLPQPSLRPVTGPGAVNPAAINRDESETSQPSSQTADLLEALRRRRGEREAASYDDLEDAMADHPSTGSIRLIDIPLPEPDPEDEPEPVAAAPTPHKSGKKGRATMPSWDEIVFGARSDDDPA